MSAIGKLRRGTKIALAVGDGSSIMRVDQVMQFGGAFEIFDSACG